MERFAFEAIDVDRPLLVGRYNPLRIRASSYLYQGPRGPVEIRSWPDGTGVSLLGPEIGAIEVPFGLEDGDEDWDEESDSLRDGIVVAIGNDQVCFSAPRTRGLPVVEATTGWATWRAYPASAYLFRWKMIDAQTGRPFVTARAWSGKVSDSPEVCRVGALIIIWAAFLDRLFAVGPGRDFVPPPTG
jgi:hypothetical protein